MAIAKSLSDLPADKETRQGEPPVSDPVFAGLLVEKMKAANDKAGPKATAHGTRTRHSDAGKCARAIAFTAAGVPPSNPMDLAGVWVTSLGTLIHNLFQEVLAEAFVDCVVEIEPKLQIEGFDSSGHADAIVTLPSGWKILCELKTTGGWSFKSKVGERAPAQGPSFENLSQAALNGKAVDADEVVIVYLATEGISKQAAERRKISELTRIAAEWSYERDEYMPIADAEQARLEGILRLVDKGELAARKVPSPEVPRGAEIVDPQIGRWEVKDRSGNLVDTGSWWGCAYCQYQTVCSTTDPGRIPVSSVVIGDDT